MKMLRTCNIYFFLAIALNSLGLLGNTDGMYQTANGKKFFVDNSDPRESVIHEITFDSNWRIQDWVSRDARWKKYRIEAVAPFGDAESLVVYAVNRDNPNTRFFYVKPRLDAKETRISRPAEMKEMLPEGSTLKRIAVIGNDLYILTTEGLWKMKITGGIEGQILPKYDWTNVTDLIAVGQYLVFHKDEDNGNLFSLDTKKLELEHGAVERIGTRWGRTSKLMALDATNFLVHSPRFDNLQSKRADASARNVDTGIAVALIPEDGAMPYQGAYLIRRGDVISLIQAPKKVSPRGSQYLMGITNEFGTCYLNAGLQAIFTADLLNDYAKLFGDDRIFSDNPFIQEYLRALNRYRVGQAQVGYISIEDLATLKSREHDPFIATQLLLTAITVMPNSDHYFINVTRDVGALSNNMVEEMVENEFNIRGIAEQTPEYVVVMLNDAHRAILDVGQQNKITFENLTPIPDSDVRYSMIAAMASCYEGQADQYPGANHIVTYKKVNDQWYFVNDRQFETRTPEQVSERINSGNATERVPGRVSKFMIPAMVVYQRHGADS